MYFLAIDIGATNLRILTCDKEGNILKRFSGKIDNKDYAGFLQIILKTVESIVNENGKPEKISVASAGLLNLKKGSVSVSNLPHGEILIVENIKRFSQEVFLMNDCDAGVIGEKIFGAAKNYDNVIYVTISTGIGSGIILQGNLLLGKDGNATEIGHTVIDVGEKMKCGCGKFGHWEAYCSGKNIPKFAKLLADKFNFSNNYENKTSEEIFLLAKSDKNTEKILNEIARYNSIGLSNLVNTFDPSIIILSGSVITKNPEFVEKIKENLEKYSINRMPEIKIAQLGDDSVIYGAVAVATGKFVLPKI